MDSDLKNKLVNILSSDDFVTQVKLLTFKDRLNIILSDDFIATLVMRNCKNNDIKLFSFEETKKIFYDHMDIFTSFNVNRVLMDVLDFSDEMMMDAYDEFDNSFYLQYIKNDNLILEAIDTISDDNEVANLLFLLSKKRNIDNILEVLLKDKEFEYIYANILDCFVDKNKIMKYLNRLSKENRAKYICIYCDDDTKREMLKSLSFGKGEVIASLNDDKEKEKYLKRINKQFYFNKNNKIIDVAKILASFKDFSYIEKYVSYLNNDRVKVHFLKDILLNMNDELVNNLQFFEKLLLSINDERYISDLFKVVCLWYKNLNMNINKDVINELLSKINSQKLLCDCYYSTSSAEVQKLVLDKLDRKNINKIVKEDRQFLRNYNILNYLDDDCFFETIEQYRFDYLYSDDMFPIFKRFAERYDLNLEHLIKLAKVGNCHILRSFNNNIKNAVNLDDESFEKYIKIFDSKNSQMDKSTLSSILNSILQKKFSISESYYVNIYINTIHDISDNNYEEAIKKIDEVCRIVNISNYGLSRDDLINGLINQNENIMSLYNTITYDYLKIKRNLYVEEHMDELMALVTRVNFEKNSLINYLMKVMPIDLIMSDLENLRCSKEVSLSDKELLNDEDILRSIIRFKKQLCRIDDLDVKAKKNLKKFNELYYSFINSRYNIFRKPFIRDVKLEYSLFETSSRNGAFNVNIMAEIDVDKVKELVFDNQELYDDLLKYLDKYKIIGIKELYSKAFSKADIEWDYSIIGSLISNFELISKTKKEELAKGNSFGFVDELDFADVLISDASIYSILLGKDDYRLIKRNPGPNASSMDKKNRLNIALSLIKKMHNRKYITVPPIEEDVKLKSNKSINVKLGNTNSMINLTYGERTESCMRIGGVGESLFNFCLLNDNGFHISFNNPNTGRLISRISGFRNGNTVFLNQLRTSLDDDYNDDDLIEACKIIGKKIIEETKNSKYPVVNVVASNGYVYRNSKTFDLGIKNCKKGLSRFYCDINEDNAVVVATSDNDELLPIKLGGNESLKYSVSREKIKKYDSFGISQRMMNIEALDKFYSGVDIDDIVVNNHEDLLFGYVGEDWYVAVLDNYKIIKYVQKNSRDIDAANREMNSYLDIVEKEIINISQAGDNRYKYSNKKFDDNKMDFINKEVRMVKR